jgi:phosphopantothenoylcysteine synthetase/decarboxylase
VYRKKVSSRLRGWNIKLVPTPKLINNLSSGKKRLLKVGFKFEPEAADKRLIAEGRDLLKESGLDFVVANTVNKKAYRAFIIGMSGIAGPLLSKAAMSKQLCGLLNKE